MSPEDHGKRPAPEPVAVIGMGCRFPGGADTPDRFWDLLLDGVNTASDVPAERWAPYEAQGPGNAAVLRRSVRRGSFLADVEGFDADFFGIAPREAELMDPQQRILLEVAWESLEQAGIPPRALAGTEAGVFVGICTDDYGRRQLEDLPGIEAWTGIGAAVCAVANRISHVLDLRGPSMSVDTACSASLVSLHLACQSLRLGESSLALAGGVNLVLSPGETVTLGLAGALAPDGRSKSFDASADGYGRGEGCGMLVLKLLSDAQRDGDRILALVRGSAVNQDGHTNGIMAPCGQAQEHVMVRACERAGVSPASVGYVEAHGTGTRLGDPMEVDALRSVYGTGRPDGEPCLVGSVKSNIGHLEGAAGVAGLIKAVLCLDRETIPAHPLPTGLNPDIPWDTSGLRVVTGTTGWPRTGEPRRTAVSSFGYGGTVAHIVLEEAPAPPALPKPAPAEPRAYPLSAASAAALRELAGDLAGRVNALDLGSVGHTLALRRSHLTHRAVVIAADASELATGLGELAADRPADGVVTGEPPRSPGTGLVWVFSGHGSQWDGMGRELLATEPAFAQIVDRVEQIFQDEIGFSPRELLSGAPLDDVDRIQTMIFVMQVGLAAVWRAYGAVPDAVIGHSVGEIAAAVTAGALTLDDGARLICRRSKLLRRAAGRGAMAMVGLPFDEVAAETGRDGAEGVVAAISASPDSTVIAGDPEMVQALTAQWQGRGLFVRTVASDVAFHSPHMDPILDELAAAAGDIFPAEPRLPMYSTAKGGIRLTEPPDGAYWAANLRNPVHLTAAVTTAVTDGHRAFLEVSPHPVISHSVGETLEALGVEEPFVGITLRRHRPGNETFLAAAGTLHCAGIEVDWSRLQPYGGLVTLPRTRWQHRRLWRDGFTAPSGGAEHHDIDSHSVLGAPLSLAGSTVRVWRSTLDDDNRPYPGRHALNGVEVVPAGVLLCTFLGAAEDAPPVLTDVAMRHPLMTAQRRQIQVVRDGRSLRLASRIGEDPREAWLTHATARVPADASPPRGALPEWEGAEADDPAVPRARLSAVGVPETGFDWTVEEFVRRGDSLRAKVQVEHPNPDAATWAPVFDAITSIAPAAFPGDPVLRMVTRIDEVAVAAEPPVHLIVEISSAGEDVVDAVAADLDGRIVARLTGLRYPVIGGQTEAGPRQLVHEIAWRPVEPAVPEPIPAGPVVVTGADQETRDLLRDALAEAGADAVAAAEAEEIGDGAAHVVVLPPASDRRFSAQTAVRAADGLRQVADRLLTFTTPPRLWALAGGEETALDHLADATACGAVRSVFADHPELRGGIIDRDADASAGSLLALLAADGKEDVLSLRGDTVRAARLARPDGPENPLPLRCRADASYLVTGAFSRTGLAAAAWLADRGAQRVVLADPRDFPLRAVWDEPCEAETRERIEAIRALEARGVTVRILSLDMKIAPQATLMLAPDNLGLPAIRGVIHAAGLPEASADATAKAKIAGALVLHELLPAGDVDFLVLLSPANQLLGLAGGDAPADAFLDALAGLRGDDTIGLSVAGISTDQLFESLDFAGRRGAGRYMVFDPAQDGLPDPKDTPLLAELAAAEPEEPEDGAAYPTHWSELSAEELREQLLDGVTSDVAVEMRLAPEALDPRRPLVEQGLDSVMTVVVRHRLEKRFGHQLPTTLLWHRPTILAIIEHLVGVLVPEQTDGQADETAPALAV